MSSDRPTDRDASSTGPSPPSRGSGTDRSLLYGLLAFQVNFIDQKTLIDVIRGWIADRSRPIRDVLKERAGLAESRLTLLDGFLRDYLTEHAEDISESLASMGPTVSFTPDLGLIDDGELRASLTRVGGTRSAGLETDEAPTASFAGRYPRRGPTRYRIIGDHKSGGLGAIYLAHDEELNRLVALKQIKAPFSDHPDYRARFLREAEITGRLQHPGVIPVYGMGLHDDGRPYYAMRFIPRGDLKQAIAAYHAGSGSGSDADGRAVDFRELLNRFLQVCQAMAYAHSRGVIHRDLKPANILLGDYGETFVVDWGLAKPVDRAGEAGDSGEETLRPSADSGSATSVVGQAIGTLGFLSPEQATGHPEAHTHLSDIYCLGSTLYCLLTGVAPFQGPDKSERARRREFPRPTRVRAGVPAALEAICLKAMAFRPRDRYPNALAIAEDLNRWLADEPVSVYRDPASKRLSRWVRRHKPLVAAAGVLVVASMMALVVDDIRVGREKARTDQALVEVRRNFALARESANDLFTLVARDLPRSPGSELVRLAQAEKVAGNYREFLRSDPNDLGLRSEAARAEREAGNIGRFTDHAEPPLVHYRRALELLDGLIAGSPHEALYRIRRAEATVDLAGHFHSLGRYREAGEHYRGALEITRSLRADPSRGRDPRRLEAFVLVSLAGYHAELGQIGQARQTSRQALDLFQALAGGKPVADDVSIKLIVSTLTMHGAAIRDDGQPGDAEPVLAEAIRMAREKVEVDQDFRFALAIALNERAQCFDHDARRRPEALRVYSEALKQLAALRRGSPAVPSYTREMALGCNGRAGVALLGGDLNLAHNDAELALKLIDGRLRSRDTPDHHSLKGYILANLGRVEFARKNRDRAATLLGQALAEHAIVCKALPDRQLDRATIQALEREKAEKGL